MWSKVDNLRPDMIGGHNIDEDFDEDFDEEIPDKISKDEDDEDYFKRDDL